jgi:hypothetical protein
MWNLSLLALAGAIWLAIFSAIVYAVRARTYAYAVRAEGFEPPSS